MTRRAQAPTAVVAAIALVCAVLAIVSPDASGAPAARVVERIVDSTGAHHFGPIAVDPSGNVWVGETDAPKVDELSANETTVAQVVDLSTSGTAGGTLTGGINSISAATDGSLWVSAGTDGTIVRIDPSVSPATAVFSTTAGQPVAIRTVGAAAWWLTQATPPELDYGTFDGTSIVATTSYSFASGAAPTDLALSPLDGSLWVSLGGTSTVLQFNVTNPLAPVVHGTYPLGAAPTAIGVDSFGAASYLAGTTVGRIVPSDSSVSDTTIAAPGSHLTQGPDGNMWFTIPSTSQVAAVTPGGTVSTFNLNTGSTVTGIVVDANDYLEAAAAESKIELVPTDVELADPSGDPLVVTGTLTENQVVNHSHPALRGTHTITTATGGQWNRCNAAGLRSSCVAIGGATSDAYTLTSADAGSTVSFTISTSNPAGQTTFMSVVSGVVAAAPPGTTTTTTSSTSTTSTSTTSTSTTTTDPSATTTTTDPSATTTTTDPSSTTTTSTTMPPSTTTTSTTTTTAPPPPVTSPPDTTPPAPPATVPPPAGPTAEQIHQFFLILFFQAIVRAQQAAALTAGKSCHVVVSTVHHKKVKRTVCVAAKKKR